MNGAIHLTASKEVNSNNYVRVGMPVKRDLCQYIKNDRTIVPGLMFNGNFTRDCVYNPGFYAKKNYTIVKKNLPMVIPPGSYKLYSIFDFGDEEVFMEWYGRLRDDIPP